MDLIFLEALCIRVIGLLFRDVESLEVEGLGILVQGFWGSACAGIKIRLVGTCLLDPFCPELACG